MMAQISPGELKGVYQSLKFAEDLVIKWLPQYKFKNWKKTETRGIKVTMDMKRKRAKEIAEKLMDRDEWRTHARSIKIDDLRDLLKINRIDDDPILSDIVYRIQTVCKLIFDTSNTYKIIAIEDHKIFKNATPAKPSVIIPMQKADVAEAQVTCNKCGKKHLLYLKFKDDPKIDKDFTAKGAKPYPKNGKMKCDCGFIIDLTGIRNQIELQIGKKVITNDNINGD